MMTVERQGDGDWRMRGIAEDDWRAPFGERGHDVAGPGNAVGMDDQGMDIVQRDTADLGPVFFDQQEAAVERVMDDHR